LSTGKQTHRKAAFPNKIDIALSTQNVKGLFLAMHHILWLCARMSAK